MEEYKDEVSIKNFLDSCNQFYEFSSSLRMPIYSDEPNVYEYFNLVAQQIRKLEFIISKLLPILSEGKRLLDKSLEDEKFMSEFQNYYLSHAEELRFFHDDFFIHSRILMDRLALLLSFLFNVKYIKGKKMGKIVDSFSSYFEHKNDQIAEKVKENINIPEDIKKLLTSAAVWYIKYLKNPRDNLLVHSEAKHRLIGGFGFFSGGNSDILDGLTFLQAYPNKIEGEHYNQKPLLKLLIPEFTSFLNQYLEIINNEAKIKIQAN